MTVVDASVFVDALVVVGPPGAAARAELSDQIALEVPAVFGAEVVSAMRSMVQRRELSPIRAVAALVQLRAARTVQYPFEPFAERVWELRDNLTVYDAWYVALAEWLGTDLVTADERLIDAPGPRCRIRLPAGEHPQRPAFDLGRRSGTLLPNRVTGTDARSRTDAPQPAPGERRQSGE